MPIKKGLGSVSFSLSRYFVAPKHSSGSVLKAIEKFNEKSDTLSHLKVNVNEGQKPNLKWLRDLIADGD